MPLEGLQIGRYRFIRKLGSGGMGEVYLAVDARIGQQVALKVIQSEVSPYPTADATTMATRLFRREAMTIAKLDHPHILPLFDYGEASINGKTLTYLVMPFRREGSLLDWLGRRSGSELLSLQDVAHIVSQTADALQHAHDRQIVHQDIKPSNLLIRETKEAPNRPDVLLADFGIAKFTTATAASSQVIRGTPTYMAPEQWAGRPVPATDQYALAIMAYELLISRPPFQGSSMQMMYQHLNVQPQPPSMLSADLPADVDTVLLHALAKHPSSRFASIAAFAQAFRQSVHHAAVARRVKMPSTSSTPPSSEGDVYAVLAISEAEARTGTTRTVTLPGGRRVTVAVPAGTQDGHRIRLEGQGEPSDPGNQMSTWTLIIAVKQTEEVFPPSDAEETKPTILMSNVPGQVSIIPEASPPGPATGTPAFNSMSFQSTFESETDPRSMLSPQARDANTNEMTGSTFVPAPKSQANVTPADVQARRQNTGESVSVGADEAGGVGGMGLQGHTPVLRDAPATARGRRGSEEGSRLSIGHRWLVITVVLFVSLLIFGGVAFAVPGGFPSLIQHLRNVPTQVTPSPIPPTPASRPSTPGVIPLTPRSITPTPRSITPTPQSIPPTPTLLPSPSPSPTP
jgi:serine/threonine protein kinase